MTFTDVLTNGAKNYIQREEKCVSSVDAMSLIIDMRSDLQIPKYRFLAKVCVWTKN